MNTAIIVPVFNEILRWNSLYWSQLQEAGIQIFFIDDASEDGTLNLIESLPGAIVLTLPKNVGKAEAVRIGMYEASSPRYNFDCIGFLDADCAFNSSEVQEIIGNASTLFSLGYESIWSSRVKLLGRNIERSPIRHLIGRVISSIFARSYSQFPYDSQCGFKIYSFSESLHESLNYKSKTRWFFELEHLSNFYIRTGRTLTVWEQPISHWKDVPGSKLYSVKTIHILRELLFIYKSLRQIEER